MSKENQIKILQMNVNRNPKKTEECLNIIDKRDGEVGLPDVLFLSEVTYKTYKKIINESNNKFQENEENPKEVTIKNEYNVIPLDGIGDLSGRTLVSMLAIRKNNKIRFISNAKRDIVSQKERYYDGTIAFENSDIRLNVFLAYVQQCASWYGLQKKIAKKAEMISKACYFVDEHKGENVFIGGDMNTDLNDPKARCGELFRCLKSRLIDTAVDNSGNAQSTWKGKYRLDYALVSKNISEKCSTEYINVDEKDHVALLTTIKFEESPKQ
ncbi:MAG: endonuclease/exonuclease/phosphatase family protein [Ruminococcaceae bacterium]|nr:endonuclease/exonuclease/phosphatase family protein [Oscillospiraceae bacterium]